MMMVYVHVYAGITVCIVYENRGEGRGREGVLQERNE
jgi:hypothetical protein